jgi:hypothetical protein
MNGDITNIANQVATRPTKNYALGVKVETKTETYPMLAKAAINANPLTTWKELENPKYQQARTNATNPENMQRHLAAFTNSAEYLCL